MQDDNLMDRFDGSQTRRSRARDGVVAILIASIALLATEGAAIRKAGEQLHAGAERQVLLALGGPAGWLADRLPLHAAVARLTSSLSPDQELADVGGFDSLGAATAAAGPPLATASAFDPVAIGAAPLPRRPLHTLLVTGDSLSTPLDLDVARRLSGDGVRVLREPHLGTGISKSDLLDWGRLSATQAKADHPDAVVVFIGANEGFPMRGPAGHSISCCGADWAAIYANRARRMMDTYRRVARARIYWISVPTPREAARRRIERVVNAAIDVAAEPWRDDIRIVDAVAMFTPGERYRDAMAVRGRDELVRASDGIHLNRVGARLLAARVLETLARDFRY